MPHLIFRKSSHSHQNQCVEIADGGSVVIIRDSKDTAGPTLRFTRTAWTAFARTL